MFLTEPCEMSRSGFGGGGGGSAETAAGAANPNTAIAHTKTTIRRGRLSRQPLCASRGEKFRWIDSGRRSGGRR